MSSSGSQIPCMLQILKLIAVLSTACHLSLSWAGLTFMLPVWVC